jgi:hypothetical protein
MGFGPDFPDGLNIVEYIEGKPSTAADGKIKLIGSFLPHIPFEHGGKQQIVKDFYPGNPEPVMQMLGPREDNVTIKGVFKAKRFKTEGDNALPDGDLVAYMYQELITAMRKRGNIVKVTLGLWKRYAVIEDCSFKLNRMVNIEYSITFSIIGTNLPENSKMTDSSEDDLEGPNTDITNSAAEYLASATTYPASMHRDISDIITDAVSTVSGAVNAVTGFVDGALKDIENINAAANRAVGLIKNARAKISQFRRRIGQIEMSVANMAAGVSFAGFKTATQLDSANHLKQTSKNYGTLLVYLAILQTRWGLIAKSIPMRRHLVKTGETLQSIAMRYYNNSDLWQNIYDHNKLRTTVLTVGTVLEIPRA